MASLNKKYQEVSAPELSLGKWKMADIPWKKMIGDYLLQRLGVPTEYFEVMADARELNGWRDREDTV